MKLQHFVAIPSERNFVRHWFQFKTREEKLEEFIVVWMVFEDRAIYHRTLWMRVGIDSEFRVLSERGPWSIAIGFLQELGKRLPANTQSPVGHHAATVPIDPHLDLTRSNSHVKVADEPQAASGPAGAVPDLHGFSIGEMLYFKPLNALARIVDLERYEGVNGEGHRFVIELEEEEAELRVPAAKLRDILARKPREFTAEELESLEDDEDNVVLSESHGFFVDEYVVYPEHGVGKITAIQRQEIAGTRMETFVIHFKANNMTLMVPTANHAKVGLRKLADEI